MQRAHWSIATVAAALACVTANAQLPGLGDRPRPTAAKLVRVRALADTPRVGPGQTFHLAVVFDIEPRWHIYWKNPGAGAMAPEVRVTAPAGFTVKPPRWGRPKAFASALGEAEYGYEREAAIFIPIEAPAKLAGGTASFQVETQYAVCREVCLLGETRGTVEVVTSSSRVGRPAKPDRRIERLRRRLPRRLAATPEATATFDGTELVVTGPAKGHERVTLFPDPSPGIEYDTVAAGVADDRFEVRVRVRISENNTLGEPMTLRGLVALGVHAEDPCYDFDVPARSRQP